MHVASLHLFDLAACQSAGDFHAGVWRLMRKRVHLAPAFTRRLASMRLQFANPMWVEGERGDLDPHGLRLDVTPRPHAIARSPAPHAEHPGMAALAAAALKHDAAQYIKFTTAHCAAPDVRELTEALKAALEEMLKRTP